MGITTSMSTTNHGDGTHTVAIFVWNDVSAGDPPQVTVTITWETDDLDLKDPPAPSPSPTVSSPFAGTIVWANHTVTANSSSTAHQFNLDLECKSTFAGDSPVVGYVEVIDDRTKSQRHTVAVVC